MKISRYLSFVVLTSLLVLSINSCSDKNAEDIMEMIDNPDDMNGEDTTAIKAPEFALISLTGDEVKLSDFSGKPLVIFFLGSTCPLCVASAPNIESKINNVFSDSQIGIVGIDTWNGSHDAVARFRTTTNTTFDLLLNGSMVQSDYMTTYDRLFVIDKNGNIVHAGTKSAGGDVDKVVTVINGLL